ncbi:valacyclovir hydrolase [Aricia agestis]|uniref:valacyclovir hydrolase n=1 Tax=Aricia agestis TaxID=91739 RepID=UPI001C20BACE|nr:valacyclovir hydrolase [Aricia agestis]
MLFRNIIFNSVKEQLHRSVYFSTAAIPKENKIKVGAHEINYVKVGKGPHTLLCTPGALGSIWTDFKMQVEGFDQDKCCVVAWDPPGYGKSRPPEREFPTDFYEKDADAAISFMKELNFPKFSLLGWSDGGIVGLILAAKYPNAINKLVVWGANSFILPHELEIYKNIRDVSKWSKKMREPMVELYGEEYFPKLWSNWIDGVIAVYNKNDGNICAEMLKNIKCPTFILHGEKDPMVDNVHVSHLHTHIEGARIHLYPDGKHNIHIKYAQDFNKRVQDFLLQP